MRKTLKLAAVGAGLMFSATSVNAQTEDEVWPAGDNGPRVWPPELDNDFWQQEMRYPEGGDPPPEDPFERLTCPAGSSKVTISEHDSARWETSRWHPPEYAFDEYTMSRWSSWDSMANWIYADMGEAKTVTRVYLIWETAFGADYDIQISDDAENWTTVMEIRNGNGQADVIEIDNAEGRYLQMWGVRTGSQYGYSLYEFTICAADGSDPGGQGGAGGAAGAGGADSAAGSGGDSMMDPTAGSGGEMTSPMAGAAGATAGSTGVAMPPPMPTDNTMGADPTAGLAGSAGVAPATSTPVGETTTVDTASGCATSTRSHSGSALAAFVLMGAVALRRRR